LKRAVQLIGQKHLTISEISFMTGYNNPKYFTKVFRKHYGMSPTEYRAMKFGS
jgi:YesN/AraC family two-component response regulator